MRQGAAVQSELPWQPILEGAARTEALSVAQAIGDALRWERADRSALRGTLEVGSAGLAVLFHYLRRVDPGGNWGPEAERYLEHAMEAVVRYPMPPALHGGFTGVAWALTHTADAEEGEEDSCTEVDQLLLEYISQSPWRGEYDLISGLVGYGVYALERLPRPSARRILAGVVDRLAELARPTADGFTWHTPQERVSPLQRSRYPAGYYNLGLAHGVPGVIGLLAGALDAGIRPGQTGQLLEGAMNWLLARQLPQESPSAFAHWHTEGEAPQPARSAWCYGDPGVAAVMLHAARAARNPEWEQAALAVAHRAAERLAGTSGVKDAAICHGAAGLAHLFSRFAQVTGSDRLRSAACFWAERTLAMREPGLGIAGYRALGGEPLRPTFEDTPGLLSGAAGIALVLLAAASPVQPCWDRALLITLPQVEGA